MRYGIALLTLVGALVILSPTAALAKGGPASLYGPFDPRRNPQPIRAGIPTPSISL
jgi:hypothetical protein